MEDDTSEASSKRRRVPKSCAACQRSKVKCDRRDPCGRCSKTNTPCQYFEAGRDSVTDKLERLEKEVARLKALIPDPHISVSTHSVGSVTSSSHHTQGHGGGENVAGSPTGINPHVEFVGNSDVLTTLQSNIPGGVLVFEPRPTNEYRDTSAASNGTTIFQFQGPVLPDVVSSGLASESETQQWFECFFGGSDRLIPVFSTSYDTFHSVRHRSSLLFDVIASIGCRIDGGSHSGQYQTLHRHLRKRISNHVVLSFNSISLETVQALLILACYWEKSWLFMDLALWMSQELELPKAVEQIMARLASKESLYRAIDTEVAEEERTLFRMARLCCGVFVLDQIFSLDGGKNSSIACLNTPRRLRYLLNHPERNGIDQRLFAQVELNSIRASAHSNLFLEVSETDMEVTLRNARIDLDLWLEDWMALLDFDNQKVNSPAEENAINVINLEIQHKWAIINVHLKALSILGIENMAAVTDIQRGMIVTAKTAAEEHLQLLLRPFSFSQSEAEVSPYLSCFRWATEFIWAKCAFSVLLALRLALLLGDPLSHLIKLGSNAMHVIKELRKVGGQSDYFAILETSVGKFQTTLEDRRAQQQNGCYTIGNSDRNSVDGRPAGLGASGPSDGAEADFRTYLPKEFSFDWDFPGLNLQYIPINWDELFSDLDQML